MAISAFPTAPSRQDPTTFANRADATLGHLPTFVTEINGVIGQTNIDATNAAGSANAAAAAETVAAGLTGFKGDWSDLSGSLNVPAAVHHDGLIWILRSNIADVAANEPSVASSVWVDVSSAASAPITPASSVIDTSKGSYFSRSISSNSSFTFASGSLSSGQAFAFVLRLTHNAGTINWPASVRWPSGATAPAVDPGFTHLFFFVTEDGGTLWRGSFLGNYTS